MRPILFISYDAKLDAIVDASAAGLDLVALGADDWQRRADAGEVPPPQVLAEALIGQGAADLLVRSFAPEARSGDLNLILWRWSPDTLRVVGDEGWLTVA